MTDVCRVLEWLVHSGRTIRHDLNRKARLSKSGLVSLLAAVAISPMAYSQTVIDVTSSTSTTVDANQTTGSPVTVNISGSAVLSGSPGIEKDDEGNLTINFSGSTSINTTGIGIDMNASVGDLMINSTSTTNPVIMTTGDGIRSAQNVTGNFTNNATVDSSGNLPIRIDGAVDGSFTNTGALIGGTGSNDHGIFIGGTVGVGGGDTGFTNSGTIGSSGIRVGGEGIRINGTVTGDFVNDAGGTIFSTTEGIFLDQSGASVIGNFTNNANINSSTNKTIEIDGAVGGSFTNAGALLSGASNASDGIDINGSVGDGFTNTGQIGSITNPDQRVRGRGIFINGTVTGNFLNDVGGDIFSVRNGIWLDGVGTSLSGNFTNRATINSSENTGILISRTLGGNFTNSGTVSGNLGVRIGRFDAGVTFTNSGTITGTGDVGVEIDLTGAGPHTLINTSTISGSGTAIDINEGGIAFTNRGIVNGNVDLEPNFPHNVTLDSSGVVNGFLEMGDDPANTVIFTGTGNALFSEEVTDGIRNEGDLNTLRALIKEGTGQWTIDQDLTVRPNATINEGTLLVEADTLLTSANGVIVNNTGALGGDGTISGAVSINSGGVLAPGASPGTITLNDDLTLNAGAMLDYELDTPDVVGGGVNDLTVVTGDLILGGVLNITDLGGFAEGSYTLIQVTGAITDNGLTIGMLPPGFEASITVTANEVILNATAVDALPIPTFGHGGLLLLILSVLLIASFAFRSQMIAS